MASFLGKLLLFLGNHLSYLWKEGGAVGKGEGEGRRIAGLSIKMGIIHLVRLQHFLKI